MEWMDPENGHSSECETYFYVNDAPLVPHPLDPPSSTPEISMGSSYSPVFPTGRRIERRSVENDSFPPDTDIISWAKEVGLTMGDEVWDDDLWTMKILKLCYLSNEVGASSLGKQTVRDLITVPPWFKSTPVSYATKWPESSFAILR
jgi:hypothetical protein